MVVPLEVGERRVDLGCYLHDADEAARDLAAVLTHDPRRDLVVVGDIEVGEKDEDDNPLLVTW